MARRKFYYGDIGEINNMVPTHMGHLVRIAGTVIRKTDNTRNNVRYTVDCECGKRLKLGAVKLEYISRPVQFPSPEEACYRRFIEETRISDREELNKRIAALNPRGEDCLRRYYGLSNKGRRETLQSIASSYGLSRERIRQVIARSKKVMMSVKQVVA